MFDFIDTQPQFEVPETEFLRLLGFPRHTVLEGRPSELANWARSWYREHGRPWVVGRAAGSARITADGIAIPGFQFRSERLQGAFAVAEAEQAMLVAVSAGSECEQEARRLWAEEKPDEYFFLEMYGSAVVEALVAYAAGRICAWADQDGLAVLPHYSPGYPGWSISDQAELWRALQQGNDGRFPGKLAVLETGMLRPKKSLLAVFGITRQVEKVPLGSRLVPCENCSLPRCQYRRAPYRYAMPQTEPIGRPWSDQGGASGPAAEAHEVLKRDARYRANSRALEKWAKERLRLEVGEDGGVTAHFRYDGTTCANLGQPLSYDYVVRLEPASEAYRVAELRCSPAAGDIGHTQMCEYLKDSPGLMEQIAAEKPLLGRPLNEVLAWDRPYSPAGCFCEASSREHKWGLVFEVIHFALARRAAGAGSAAASWGC